MASRLFAGLMAEDRARSPARACEICGVQSSTDTGFSHSTSFSRQYYPTNARYSFIQTLWRCGQPDSFRTQYNFSVTLGPALCAWLLTGYGRTAGGYISPSYSPDLSLYFPYFAFL